MIDSVKILFTSIYFDYTIFGIVSELNRSKIEKICGISYEIPNSRTDL